MSSSARWLTRQHSRSLLALTVLAAILAACTTPSPRVTSVSVTAPAALLAGRSAQALAEVVVANGASTAVEWSTSDPVVATVDQDGRIAALSEGSATITATSQFDATKSGSVEISVSNALRGAKVLYYVDGVHAAADRAREALDDAVARFGASVLQTDDADFVSDLESVAPDLVVYLRQNDKEIPDDAEAALLAWVDGGGALAFASWDEASPDVVAQLAAMEAVTTGSHNYSSFEVTSPTLSAGLSSTTLPLVNLGWGRFSLGLQAAGGGEELAHFYDDTPALTTQAALVAGNGGRTMALGFLSDTPAGEDGARLLRNVFEYVLVAALP